MPRPAIKRRLERLEGLFVVDRLEGIPPLTKDEIEELAKRPADGGQIWTDEEAAMVIRQCPIIQGELMIKAHGGQVTIKRYLGIDTAWF